MAKKQRVQKKSGTSKKRRKGYSSTGKSGDPKFDDVGPIERSSGPLASMVGGFRRAVGRGDSSESSGIDVIWFVLVVVVVGAIAFFGFGGGR